MDDRRRAPGDDSRTQAPPDEEPPPVLGSWRALYALVIGELLLVIALCGWLAGLGR
jgi:hypothetical protein